jgi:hypothetical protein
MADRTELELRQQYEIRKMELSVEFAKYGFYGTLIGAITAMVILVVLAIVVALGKIENGGYILVAFAAVGGIAVVAFGYFSLFNSPVIGVEWDKFKTTIGTSANQSLQELGVRINALEKAQAELQAGVDKLKSK